jgi:hypothetical protein
MIAELLSPDANPSAHRGFYQDCMSYVPGIAALSAIAVLLTMFFEKVIRNYINERWTRKNSDSYERVNEKGYHEQALAVPVAVTEPRSPQYQSMTET